MNMSSWVSSIVVALLIIGVFSAGCTDDSTPAGNTTAQPSAATTAVTSVARYSAGDIVKNPTGSSTAGLLIISYDSGTDKYERAYIYPNTDGSWGYRLDSKTETISRSTIEKVYTQKAGTVEVSAVPVRTPATAATTVASSTTKVTTVATATTTKASPPHVTGVDPDSGKTGTTVSITELKGKDFQTGANVTLKKTGQTSIVATNVVVASSALITCSFVIPSDASTGIWDILVTNPDGQYHQYQNALIVTQGTATTTTTTTTTTGTAGKVTIISLSPEKIVTGGADAYKEVDFTGTNLTAGASVKLTQGSSTISSETYSADSNTQSKAFFNIPGSITDSWWTITVLDSSGNILGTLANGLEISMT